MTAPVAAIAQLVASPTNKFAQAPGGDGGT